VPGVKPYQPRLRFGPKPAGNGSGGQI
jgi:hypothetical protein